MKAKLLQHKWKLLITSVVILLPALFGLIVWDKLPERVAVHWGVSGNADGWSSALFAVLGLPLILLALHWFCMIVTFCDKKQDGQSRKAFGMIFWIVPVISLYVCGMMYATAFGLKFDMYMYISVLLGVMFIVIGNYLPKCKQNRTLGIKIAWTLANEENWNKTHRLGGKVGVACGVLTLLCAFLPSTAFPFVAFGLILANVIVPTVYSYRLYRRHLREGVVYTFAERSKASVIFSVILTVLVVVFCLVICFTGEVKAVVSEHSLSIEATFWEDALIDLDRIEGVELVERFDAGTRVNGFGSPRLLLGWFENDTLGSYTLYGYTKSDVCIVLTVDGKTVAVGLESAEETRALYETLTSK